MSSVIEVVVETPVIEVIQDGLDTVEVVEAINVIEVVDGLSLPGDVVAALNAADAPSAENPFATMDAMGTLLEPNIVAALNAAETPSAENPFVTKNQGDSVRFARLFMMGA